MVAVHPLAIHPPGTSRIAGDRTKVPRSDVLPVLTTTEPGKEGENRIDIKTKIKIKNTK